MLDCQVELYGKELYQGYWSIGMQQKAQDCSEQKEKSGRKFNSIQRGNREVPKAGRGESRKEDMSEGKVTMKP